MLPVSTPCNAIVYGSGYIPLTRMIRYGLILDIAGIVVVVTMLKLLVPADFGKVPQAAPAAVTNMDGSAKTDAEPNSAY